MKNDREKSNVLFHSRANDVMNTFFREFKASVATINRLHDENVFQHQLGKYLNHLKHSLDNIALEVIEHSGPGTSPNEWNHTLSQFIQNYIQEFRQKAKSL